MAERRTSKSCLGWLTAALGLYCVAGSAFAQTSVLFSDDFGSGFGQWTEQSAGGDASVGGETGASGNSMRLRWGVVNADSNAIDASGVTAASLTAWIRRGSDAFSEDPDGNEDLVVQFRDALGIWNTLETFAGNGSAGQIYTPSYALPAAALHANLAIRFRLTGGNGADNDYWHVDDVVVTGTLPATGLDPNSCEDFESGLGSWVVVPGGGDAGTSAATANSPSNSLYLRWGPVSVTSLATDLSGAGGFVDLDIWVRRGSDSFSENPEAGEDLIVEYLSSGGAWNALETFGGGGTQGEVFTRRYSLPGDALFGGFRLRFRLTGGNGADFDYWHVDDVCLSSRAPILYSFEEESWTGAGGEVEDANGSGLDGTVFGGGSIGDATAALAGNPGTCRYGEFDGVDDYIEVPDDPAFDLPTQLTSAAWIYMHSYPPELHTIVSKDTNYEYHIDSAGRVYWWWNDSVGTVRSITTAQRIQLNRWYHVAISYQSGSQVVYVDGVPWGTSAHAGLLAVNNESLYIGTDVSFISRAFDGFIDEVTVAPQAYTQAEVQALRDATHPCAAAAAQFTINHDTLGIHCLPETITVNVIDAIAGTPLNSYNGTVRIDTQSGNGTWSLLAGGGAFADAAAGDGMATYDWPLGETQVQFQLYYPQGTPAIDIDAFQTSDPGIRDTDAEGLLTFAPNGFTVTAVPISNPPGAIVPFDDAQTAAVPFDVYIAAYGETPDDPTCGVIESYTGTRPVKFWSDYVNPGGGSRQIEVDGNPVSVSEAGAGDQNVTFTNGQARVQLKYKDAGSIRLSLRDDTTPTGLVAGIRGATAAFVSRPADFVLSDIRDAAGTLLNPQAADASGGVFVAAGADFRATVTAIDAEGDPTPNFGRESSAASVELESVLVAPVGGREPGIVAAAGFGAFSGGSATGVDFSWSEVGIVQLRPSVLGGDYLGAGDVVGTPSENIGRFVPSHFALGLNTPMLATQCTMGANSFTYAGQPFGYVVAPMITATAMSVDSDPLENYTGQFFRLASTTLANRTYSSASISTLDTSGVPPAATDPVVTESGPGEGTIQFDASGTTRLQYSRASIEPPFNADISLSIDVIDADNVAAASNPAVFDGTGNGIAFSAGPDIRFGRMRFVNAVGSERVMLPLPLVSEYFDSAANGFVRNDDDACTTDVTLAFTAFTENLDAGETCVLDSGSPGASGIGCAAPAAPGLRYAEPPIAGSFNVRLAPPGPGNQGSAVVTADVPAWLRYDWDAGVAGNENPTGIAAFGLYGGEGAQIYTRELY